MPTVLLIEDDSESRRTTAELFGRENWEILEAGDGEAGIHLALKHRPELILCDLLMPKANGFQVCRSLRQLLQRTKIIIVSGRDYGVDRKSALEAGADEYLVKPIRWENLHEVIERVLLPADIQPSGPVPDFVPPSTRVKFWGVRGSIPVPGSSTVGYGGNTSCVEVRADGEIIILDAGSGLRELGIELEAEFGGQPIRPTLLISHTHWDHIQGLPFFLPVYSQKNSLRVLGYEGARAGLATVLAGQMETSFFPVSLRDVPSAISIDELKDMEFTIGKVKVTARFLNHPGICVGYRLTTSNGSIAFLPDNEPYDVLKLNQAGPDKASFAEARAYAADARTKLVEFLQQTDILIIDAQYTDEEYAEKVGWGHGSLSSVVSLAVDARVRKLFLFHHDPNHDDRKIDEMVEAARTLVLESGRPVEVEAAREGAEVWLGAKTASVA
ncbi:MAG TPA: response regulator [Chthoniobacterales bacterium]|jgi:phosphoribosyl 1,2-cyclic phosphodiesterase/CheY-like chemotaxis protein